MQEAARQRLRSCATSAMTWLSWTGICLNAPESKPVVQFGSIQTSGSSWLLLERPNWRKSKLWTQARMTTSQNRSVCPNYSHVFEPTCGVPLYRRVKDQTLLRSDRKKIQALDAGADDYITKPFSMPELLARIRANLRRAPLSPRQGPNVIAFDEIQVDLDSHHVSTQGRDVRLTPKQFEVLNYLIANPNVSIPHRSEEHTSE